ncbi:MAG: septum formation initiator family protein [Patescibacteria group bacterium]
MNSYQDKKSDFRKLLESWPSLVFLTLILLFFAVNIILFIGKMVEAKKTQKVAEEKVVELELKKEQLNSEISSLNTEKGKEELIREKFGLAKEGEEMIVVVNKKEEDLKLQEGADNKSFRSFWRNLFK